MARLTSEEAMNLAIEEARKGLGFVSPNPPVGCVILNKAGELVAKGHHMACGKAHAEVAALKAIKNSSDLEEAHVFVTLEPCSHTGRTGPCAVALAELPITTVIYGLQDPNPKVAGKGLEILRQAGKVVSPYNGLSTELNELIEVFRCNQEEQKPFVALKTATSLDGKMSMKTGESKWLTNEVAREHSHMLRAHYDAILVGRGTVEVDDPSLNVRHPQFPNFENKVVVLDPHGKIFEKLPQLNLFKNHKPQDIFVVVAEGRSISSSDCETIECPLLASIEGTQNESLAFDLDYLLRRLFEKEIYSLYVEGGARTYKNFLEQNEAHRLYHFIAPSLLGGATGRTWTEGFAIEKLENRPTLKEVSSLAFGDNVLITGRLK